MKGALSKISITFFSELKMTNFSEDFFRFVIKRSNLSKEKIDWIALSLREAINNAIIHGNKNNPDKKVEVEIEFKKNKLNIRVWDEGKGFDPKTLKDPTKKENLLKPHGRGIFLMKQFVDEVRFLNKKKKFGIELKINV